MKEVKDLILASHLKDPKSHSSICPGENGYHQRKYYVYTRHQSAFYFFGNPKAKISGKHLTPPGDEQRDKLISQVLAECSICNRLKKEKEAVLYA